MAPAARSSLKRFKRFAAKNLATDMPPRANIFLIIEVLATCPEESQEWVEDWVVKTLVSYGLSEIEAETLLAFVPLAIGRELLRRMPSSKSVQLSPTVLIRNWDKNYDIEIRAREVPLYVEAEQVAKKIFEEPTVGRAAVAAVIRQSAEVSAVTNALNAHVDIEGAKIGAPVLLRLGGAHGFDDWVADILLNAPD